MKKPLIAIVNSSTFGKHFSDHIETLKSFADLKRVDVPITVSNEELISQLQGVNGIIASVTPKFPRPVLEALTDLVLLVRHGIGCDNVDLEAATELGILVSRVQGIVERNAVSEHAISLLMSAARYIPNGCQSVRNSAWSDRGHYIGLELGSKTIGIIGLGNIGSKSSEILSRGFNARVLACDPYITDQRFKEFGAIKSDLEPLLRESDAVLFHCPLTPETERMIGKSRFSMMKRGAILVNTCRGELIDEDASVEALKSKQLGYYATDVVEKEPIDGNHRLAKLDNVIITPHLGGYTWESLRGMGQTGVDDSVNVFQKKLLPGQLANEQVLDREYRRWS